ncbi:hypothetical protein GcM1_c11610o5 [Golovinomyces cichoracearum]|uniref:Uncharacterized protein n=1 Tax=Golovinomyces cichoracearum TaxID=62708 RepID=A0A420IMJ2_9PEZI|nr:hypothetical protein GcM1_c11610o5 [Golovinomyces cichoracearum]
MFELFSGTFAFVFSPLASSLTQTQTQTSVCFCPSLNCVLLSIDLV